MNEALGGPNNDGQYSVATLQEALRHSKLTCNPDLDEALETTRIFHRRYVEDIIRQSTRLKKENVMVAQKDKALKSNGNTSWSDDVM